jgi:methylphosphotriester-DNA--protein-cysteine methyltransferase
MDFSTPSSRWTALTTRNRHADTHFVYAVKTTKIYCRPSCAARLARRANVEFYNTPIAATKAGFRACKRCKPDLEPQIDPQDVAVAKACEIIRAALSSADHANGHVGLNELAERVQLTPSYLHKTFKAKMGMTPKKYAENLRQQQAPAVAIVATPITVSDSMVYDAYASFMNDLERPDFVLDGMTGLDSVIDAPELTSEGISDTLTSLNTPTTVDWSWLDTLTPPVEAGEFFDANTFDQNMQHQDCTGWNHQLYSMAGRDEEILLGTVATQNSSDRTMY